MWLVLFTGPGLQCLGRVERVEGGRLFPKSMAKLWHGVQRAVVQYLPSVPCLSQ